MDRKLENPMTPELWDEVQKSLQNLQPYKPPMTNKTLADRLEVFVERYRAGDTALDARNVADLIVGNLPAIIAALRGEERMREALATIAEGATNSPGQKRPFLGKFAQQIARQALEQPHDEG